MLAIREEGFFVTKPVWNMAQYAHACLSGSLLDCFNPREIQVFI